MKKFINTKLNPFFTFSSCDICESKCCDGRNGTVFSQLLLEDFELVSKRFPIVFLLGDLGFLKPVILLTNGKSYCRYLKDSKCSIYETRPSICRVYPLSPHLTNDIFIDTLCPAVNEKGNILINNGIITQKSFNNEIFDNYKDKYINMHLHFENYNNKENLEVLIEIAGDTFYKFKEDFNDKYLKIHQSSLKNFDGYFTT